MPGRAAAREPRGASRKRKRQQNGNPPAMPLLPPELNEDEIVVSDEDIEFVQQNQQFAKVLAGLDTKGITKHILGLKPDWNEDSLERFYEKRASKAGPAREEEPTLDPADVLPVKDLEGKLEFRRPDKKTKVDKDDKPPPTKEESLKKEGRKKAKAKPEKLAAAPKASEATTKVIEELQPFLSTEERRIQTKAQIAELCTGLLSNAEESLAPLKELLSLCSDTDQVIAHLATLSLLAVFKDIVPGYRIRQLTDKELGMPVSKEIKKIRDYESLLLRNYQAYIQMLEKALKKSSTPHIALKCMCGLLEAVPHFNYRDRLLRATIPFTNSEDESDREVVCSALMAIFKQEGKHGGDATLEAVQLISDFVKQYDCQLNPDVLRPFLALRFDEDLGKPQNRGEGDKKTSNRKYKTKREEKKATRSAAAEELKKEVEEELRQASSAPDDEERRKLQSLTLSAVFETYFRVLKSAVATAHSASEESQMSHPLLGVSLGGLLRYSHLISVEFLGDLLAVLRKLAEGRPNAGDESPPFTLEERLQCCSAAFKIMKLNMDALTVDLREFYVQFYNILLEITPERDHDSETSFANAMQTILCDSRQHDMQRVAAFIKRLASVSLHLKSGPAMSALATIRLLLSRYKQCRNLLENDEGGGGGSITAFVPDGSDPDLSGALSSVLWETTLLSQHYNPEVAKFASQIANMESNSEALLLSAMSPTQAIAAFSTLSGGFRPAVKPPSKPSKKKVYPNRWLEEHVLQDDDGCSFRSYFRLLRDIRDNHLLRKELMRTESALQSYQRYKQQQQRRQDNERKKKKSSSTKTKKLTRKSV